VTTIRDAARSAAGNFPVDVHMNGFDADTFVLDASGDSVAPVDLARITFATCAALAQHKPGTGLILSRNGAKKFAISAEAVAELGDDAQPPLYRMRILPTRAEPLDGGARFTDPQGGALYVMGASAENMTEFARRWLINP
jgi:hypothetical protein